MPIVAVILAVVLGGLSGRLLGVPTGPLRGLLAGVVGAAVGFAVTRAVTEFVEGDQATTTEAAVVLAIGLLVSMATHIALESVSRSAAAPKGALALAKWSRQRLAIASRVREIAGHARSRGLRRFRPTDLLTTPEGVRAIRLFLEDCGGLFVKFGQIASTRSDLIGDLLAAELALLQTQARPLDGATVVDLVEAELGRPLAEVFSDFDREPLGSASIGQTHLATLIDGSRVVVKVLRPGLRESFDRDSAVLRWAAETVDARWVGLPISVSEVADELIRGVGEEMNLLNEARAVELLSSSPNRPEGVHVPKAYIELCTPGLLVEQAVTGVPVGSTPLPPEQRTELARRLLRCFVVQVLVDGHFHADPHPGNVLLDPDGGLWLIDFGATGRLSAATASAFRTLGAGVAMNDNALMARAVRDLLGPEADAVDLRSLERDIDDFMGGGNAFAFDPEMVGMLVRIVRKNGLRPPADLTLLGRTLLTLSGTLLTIDPAFDFTEEGTEALQESVAPEGLHAHIRTAAKAELMSALPTLRELPVLTESLARQLRAGTLTMRIDPLSSGVSVAVQSWVDRLMYVSIACAGLLASAVLLVGSGMARDQVSTEVLRVIGLLGLVVSSAMAMRVVARTLRRGSLHG